MPLNQRVEDADSVMYKRHWLRVMRVRGDVVVADENEGSAPAIPVLTNPSQRRTLEKIGVARSSKVWDGNTDHVLFDFVKHGELSERRMERLSLANSFPDHQGIPGHQGGSLPKGEHAIPATALDAAKIRVNALISEQAGQLKKIETYPIKSF